MRRLALIACLLTVCITAASAFIRHWQGAPGCDGRVGCTSVAGAAGAASNATPATPAAAAGAAANASSTAAARSADAAADGGETPTPVLLARVAHRVAASAVGIIAIALVFVGWSRLERGERIAAGIAFVLTAGLAWLGRHTPSELPLVTLGNVAGGFALAAAFAWVAARPARGGAQPGAERGAEPRAEAGAERGAGTGLAWAAFGTLIAMTALGVLISARGALDGCPTLLCLPADAPTAALFDPRVASIVADASGAQALHLVHRIAGIVFALLVLGAGLRVGASAGGRPEQALSVAVCLGLLVQAGFGAVIAAGAASPAIAAAHNAGAALLAVALAALARRGATGVRGSRR